MAPRDPDVILVVEDDPAIRQLILWMLDDRGYNVVSASDGREALNCATQYQPSLVILDLGLPIYDGVHVAGALRAGNGPAPELIVVSADRDAQRKAVSMGASTLIHKPFDIDVLLDAVDQVMSRSASPKADQAASRGNSSMFAR